MQIKLFTIPITGVNDYNDELNTFLRSHKIVEIEKQLMQNATGAYWCLYISYLEQSVAEKASPEKIDYMKKLPPEIFAKFSSLRQIRKDIANKENVSAFVVFTDAELAEIAQMQEITPAKLKQIKGIGKAKADKYGAQLIEKYLQATEKQIETTDEKNGLADTKNSEF